MKLKNRTQIFTQIHNAERAQIYLMQMNFLYPDESYKIRGACFWVWKEFGSAFKESVVENALIEELRRRGFTVEQQKRLDIYYQNKKVGTYIPDMIINSSIIIELKAKNFLIKEDIKQFWHYLKGTDFKLGFLINFGYKLEIERIVYDQARLVRQDLRADLRNRSASDLR